MAMVLCVLPMALVLALIFKKRKEQRQNSIAPFKDLSRRPAGETLRIKLQDLDDNITDEIIGLVLPPIMTALVIFCIHPKDILTLIILILISASASAFFGVRLFKLIQKRANYQLGYDGERFVGEELSRLIQLGFEIYHDVPFEGFNIDHVLVGPRGVFIVETKTRRKPVNEAGKKEFKVQFDGKALQWPWGADGYQCDQPTPG
jgi:hypothetical protein